MLLSGGCFFSSLNLDHVVHPLLVEGEADDLFEAALRLEGRVDALQSKFTIKLLYLGKLLTHFGRLQGGIITQDLIEKVNVVPG